MLMKKTSFKVFKQFEIGFSKYNGIEIVTKPWKKNVEKLQL
jgi:hypothetical protein